MKIETFVLTAFQQNTRVVSCEATRKAICIDPGEPSQEVVDYIRKNNLELQAIILTHGHLDHIGGTTGLRPSFPTQKFCFTKMKCIFTQCCLSSLY